MADSCPTIMWVTDAQEATALSIGSTVNFSSLPTKNSEANKWQSADFDLRGAIEDAVRLVAVKAQEKGLELVCLIDQDLPSRLRGDSGRLRQILINLAGNAVKFADRGEVIVRAGLVGQNEHCRHSLFS
jgi:signal transduction histidine kinase